MDYHLKYEVCKIFPAVIHYLDRTGTSDWSQ